MGIALVTNTTIKGASSSTTPAVNTTGANFLVAVISYYTGTTPTVNDSNSNTWTALTQYVGPNSVLIKIFYSTPTTVGSGHTFGFTGTNCYASLEILAFSGMAASSVYQGLVNGGNSSGTTVQPGSISPTGSTLIICGVGWSNISSTSAINDSFSITNSNNGSPTNFGGAAAYLIQTSGSAINPQWTIATGGSLLVATQAAFRGASTGIPGSLCLLGCGSR